MDKAARIEKEILRKLASVGQDAVARAMDVDESTVSRLKGRDGKVNLGSIANMLVALDLKVVPDEMRCYRPEDIEPYIQLAKRHLEQLKSAEDLVWEDPE